MRIPLQTKALDQIDQRQRLARGIEVLVMPGLNEPGEHVMTAVNADAPALPKVQPRQGVVATTAAH